MHSLGLFIVVSINDMMLHTGLVNPTSLQSYVGKYCPELCKLNLKEKMKTIYDSVYLYIPLIFHD